MKKWIAFLLTIVMILSLGACGAKDDTHQNSPEKQPAATAANNSVETESANADNYEQEKTVVSMEQLMCTPETSVNEFSFLGDAENGYVVSEYLGADAIVVIPANYNDGSVVSVDGYTFGVNSSVQAIRFPDTMAEIGSYSCGLSPVLKYVVTGTGLKVIGESAFQACEALETVVFHDGLETIGAYAFYGCTTLESVSIPSSVKAIDFSTFMFCAEGFTIYGEAGSYAETFAGENGINFVAE